jgi:hypothetical protein
MIPQEISAPTSDRRGIRLFESDNRVITQDDRPRFFFCQTHIAVSKYSGQKLGWIEARTRVLLPVLSCLQDVFLDGPPIQSGSP